LHDRENGHIITSYNTFGSGEFVHGNSDEFTKAQKSQQGCEMMCDPWSARVTASINSEEYWVLDGSQAE
jgi:hypothetical protein